MNNLAISYSDAGQEDKALQLKSEMLELSRQNLGPEHPTTLVAMNNLGWSYHKADQEDKALQLYEQAVELSCKVRGPEHPQTLLAMTNCAISCNAVGRVGQAVQLAEQVLERELKVHGPNHEETSEARNHLVRYYKAAERWADAAALQRERIAIAATDAEVSSLVAEAAALLVLADDKDGYRKLRDEMLQRFASTDKPEIADRVTRMSLLLEKDGDHVGQVLDIVQRALERAKDEKVASDLHLTSALAAFDQGDTATAAEQLEQVTPYRDFDLRLLLKCLIHLDRDELPPSRRILLHLTAFHEGSPPPKRPTAYHLLSHRIWEKAIGRWDLRPLVRWARQVDDWVTVEFSQTTCSNTKVQFERQDDGSYLLVGEADDHETYTLTWPVTSKAITALRFEQLCDDRLPQSGPGRDPVDGTFRVSDLTLEIHRKGQEGESKTLVWQDAIPLDQNYPHRPA
ncbi:MAG: tetratricopeptide repeat protein [Planctomycetes bacterium]|nr:tetratricopeptide repeat protein [Planctomycetota bacterium]